MGFEHTLVGVAAAWTFVLAAAGTASAQATTGSPSSWPDGTTSNTPFPRSMRIKNDIRFSGRYFTAPNAHADTFYPSWASDGSMYSPYADGQVNGTSVQGYGSTDNENTASVRVDGDDPTALTFTVVSTFGNSPLPYAGRYPSASLVYGGVWYYGTYALDDLTGPCGNWCTLGPFIGFRQSTDGGKTWTDTKYQPSDPLFGESAKNGSKVKFGPVHMVDFGKNMEHSPDGYAYFVSQGANGANGQANWILGDAIYLGRVMPTPKNMDDRASFQFYSGGTWSNNVADAKPILLWAGRLGNVSVTFDAPLNDYLMWVCRPHDPSTATGSFDTLLLEADQVTGPYRLVTTWMNFGPQAYFANVPSKFMSADGETMWLLYSANFTNGPTSNPPGSGYDFTLRELTFTGQSLPDAGQGASGAGGTTDAGKNAGGTTASAGSSGSGAAGSTKGGSTGSGGSGGSRSTGRGETGGEAKSVDGGAETSTMRSDSGCGCRQVRETPSVRAALAVGMLACPLLARVRRRARK